MKTRVILTFTCMAVMLLTGCYYDEVVVFEGTPTGVSLKNDVQPIFDKNCNTAKCHDEAGTHAPILVYPQTYNALLSGGFVNTVEPDKSVLYVLVNSGEMPPSGPIDVNSQKLILGWITDGAKNN